jgi:hypothetical protein
LARSSPTRQTLEFWRAPTPSGGIEEGGRDGLQCQGPSGSRGIGMAPLLFPTHS